ncbi:MAG: SemiSWEET transporter [Rhizobacter sp.]|nr:SemiSWEET transporter [Ferruginibacter sp.]
MQTETWIGLGASICTGISMLPQLIKTYKEKKAGDISYAMLAILMVGLGLWVWYGIVKNDWIIIVSNAISLLINGNIVLLNLLYKDSRRS